MLSNERSRKISLIIIAVVSLLTAALWLKFVVPGSGNNYGGYVFLAVLGCGCAVYNIYKMPRINKVQLAFIVTASLIFGICGCFANYALTYGVAVKVLIKMATIFVASFLILFNMSIAAPGLLEKFRFTSDEMKVSGDNNDESKKKLHPVVLFFISAVSCFLVYFIYFKFAVYPGTITTDSLNQLKQVMGVIPYSNHHPYYHTQLIHLFVWIGQNVFGSLNAGIVLYMLFQMFAMAVIFAYAVSTLYEFGMKLRYCVLVMAGYALLPYNVSISSIMWKDILFGVFVLWTIIESFRLMNSVGRARGLHMFLLWIAGVGMCLFRSNGFVCFVFTFVLMVAWLRLKIKKYWKIALIYVLIIVTGWFFKKPVLNKLEVESDNLAAISIQVQQICRVYKDGGEFTEEEAAYIENMMGFDYIEKKFKPHRSVYIMQSVRLPEHLEFYKENKGQFNKIWLSIGKRYPRIYFNEWVDMTRGYWYPGAVDVNNGMPTQQLKKNKFGIERSIPSEKLAHILTKYVNIPNDTGFMFVVDIAMYVWLLVMSVWYSMYKKHDDALVPMLAISVVLSLLPTTPIWNCFRYTYAIFTATPFCVAYIATKCLGNNKKVDNLKMQNKL